MSDRIEKIIELKAPVDRVWRALTDADQFGQWFGVNIYEPFAVGRRSSGRMTIPGHEGKAWDVEVLRMDRPSRFAFNWHPGGCAAGHDLSQEPPTLVEFHLQAIDTGTRLTLVESGFDALPAERREQAFSGNSRGWDFQLENIKRHAESEPAHA